MSIQVEILDGPLPADGGAWSYPGAGAVVGFDGVVRPQEGEGEIDGLRYQAYQPMAERELARLARAIVERFGVLAVRVAHSRGFVPAAGCSFRLRIAAAHRKEAIWAMDWFIDQLKRDVPIWKSAVDAVERAGAGQASQ